MSTIRFMPSMAISNKPITKNNFIIDRKPNWKKVYYVNVCCMNGSADPTGLRRRRCSLQCKATNSDQLIIIPTTRRSGHYKPPIWDFDFVQSLNNEYKEERFLKRASELMFQVNMMLDDEKMEVVQKLELIDDLQRLGISYHFEGKINQILNYIYHHDFKNHNQTDLYSTALRFRLLRQHGFSISQEVFDNYMNNNGYFNISLGDDIKGMLQLYEASFLLTQGENVLELAREFASKILQENIEDEGNNGNFDDEYLSLLVRQALKLPLHWRIQRINATWFINAYERRPDMNPLLLELAKLDFNIVQATHQQELKHVSSWWKETCLAEKLPFARDWVVECYFWNFGAHIEPQYRYSRIMATKVSALITIIDDMFDVYGTFQELQLFNNAIQGWDIEAMDKLPDYMQMCFLGLNNFIDEMAYHVLKEQGFLIIPYLRKSWADYCRALLQEAEWCSRGYTPKLEEYINNAWMSISFPVILTHAFFSMTNPIEEETVQSLYKYHNIVRYSSTIIRLANDLSTSEDEMKKGDVPKSIQCYMNETGASREEAREHIKFLTYEMWKKLNEERVADSPFQSEFVKAAVDHVRMGLAVYGRESMHGNYFHHMKNPISSFLFQPIA